MKIFQNFQKKINFFINFHIEIEKKFADPFYFKKKIS
jgi:hypothetical protein